MFCAKCGSELKEGAFCEGCGAPNLSAPTEGSTGKGWALIILGVILAGVGIYFFLTASQDISTAQQQGDWWLIINHVTLSDLYVNKTLGIVGTVLGTVLAIIGVKKVWIT